MFEDLVRRLEGSKEDGLRSIEGKSKTIAKESRGVNLCRSFGPLLPIVLKGYCSSAGSFFDGGKSAIRETDQWSMRRKQVCESNKRYLVLKASEPPEQRMERLGLERS